MDIPKEKLIALKAILTQRLVAIEANAGTGKTMLLELALKAIYSKGNPKTLVAMFNTKVRDEFLAFKARLEKQLGRKLDLEIATYHSLGNRLLRPLEFSEYGDNEELLAANAKLSLIPESQQPKAIAAYQRMKVELDKAECDSWETIEQWVLASGLDLKVPSDYTAKLLHEAWTSSLQGRANKSVSDMVALVSTQYAREVADAEKCGRVFLDEAQDASPEQVALALAYASEDAKVALAGDGKQSINGFQGALGMDGAIRACASILGCRPQNFPLAETFRNPQAIVQYVNNYFRGTFHVGGISKKEGGILKHSSSLSEAWPLATSDPSHVAVLAPTNAMLFPAFADALGNGVAPIYTRLGGFEQCLSLSENAMGDMRDASASVAEARALFDAEADGMLSRVDRTASQVMSTDAYMRVAMGRLLCDAALGMGLQDTAEAAERLLMPFRDADAPKATLATINAVKGLTFGHTFLMGRAMLRGMAENAAEGDRDAWCKLYVGMTRCSEGLYFIEGDKG